MTDDPDDGAGAAWPVELVRTVDALTDEYRDRLQDSLDDLTEDEARARLVPSRTTLLGLLKHVTYVEGVWFDQALTGRSATEAGIAADPDASFALGDDDTVASVRQAHRERTERSRRALAERAPDAVVTGRGEHAVWALRLQVLRELAHHAGHADILREQVLAARGD